MNWRIIKSLVLKDFLLFFRDKFFGIMTIAGLIMYIIFYLLMPNKVDEKIEIGLYSALSVNLFEKFEEEGLVIVKVETDSILKQAIIDKKSWNLPSVFHWIQGEAHIDSDEMLKTFNCGIGYVIVVKKDIRDSVINHFQDEGIEAYEIGSIKSGEKSVIINHD